MSRYAPTLHRATPNEDLLRDGDAGHGPSAAVATAPPATAPLAAPATAPPALPAPLLHPCAHCRAAFNDSRWLYVHARESHGDGYFAAGLAAGRPMYACLVEGCGGSLPTPSARAQHMVGQHGYPAGWTFEGGLPGGVAPRSPGVPLPPGAKPSHLGAAAAPQDDSDNEEDDDKSHDEDDDEEARAAAAAKEAARARIAAKEAVLSSRAKSVQNTINETIAKAR